MENIIRKFFRRIFVGVIAIMNMRIDISEGIDTNKTSAWKECILCHYIFVSNICNKCHDVLMTAYELKKHSNTECKRCWL